MKGIVAIVLAASLAGCSLFSTQRPAAPDQPGDCTTSYQPPRTDMITTGVLTAPLTLLGLVALVDWGSKDEDEDFDGDPYKPYLVPSLIAAAVGIPFAASWQIGIGRVDACRRSRGMMTGAEAHVAWSQAMDERRAEVERREAACRAAGPVGQPTQVTLTGTDVDAPQVCATAGLVAVHGRGMLRLTTPECPPMTLGCSALDESVLYQHLAERLPGVAIDPGYRPGEACGSVDADDRVQIGVADWGAVDSIIAAARDELERWNLSPRVAIEIIVSPACSSIAIEAAMPPAPPEPPEVD